MTSAPLNAVIAAHRFGLGEARLDVVGNDPAGWLKAQIGPADRPVGRLLASSQQGLAAYTEQKVPTRALLGDPMPKQPAMAGGRAMPAADDPPELREIVNADIQSRLLTAAQTRRPFAERLTLFWANHFSVSILKSTVRGLAGAMEREAIRPHIAGNFETLLRAAATHPSMLRYLDNNASAGPHSRTVQRNLARRGGTDKPVKRATGLNENLAREIMELHTLGVANGGGSYGPWGGYTQADVTAFAAVLTGWRATDPPRNGQAGYFEPNVHEPGPKRLLGKTYPEGPEALNMVLHDLATHPSTARFIATKLARHFVADEPPVSLVDKLARSFSGSGGDLAAVYRTLIDAPESWDPAARKLKTPEEFGISTLRVLGVAERHMAQGKDSVLGSMGQRPMSAPSPAGWPDKAEEWLGPDAVWKRVEWAMRIAERADPQTDARALARASLGARLSDTTERQIERAADGQQALVLLLMSPEFQRR
ncbi:MAG TPA: DUF1800 domain-containing protein [Ideonella sp.]|nr:DUF1800 domain-containing protein [Ideonella sp.]